MKDNFIITVGDLQKIIAESAMRNTLSEKGTVLKEGVHYNEKNDSFSFDFQNDNETDIISLTKVGYKISTFNHCYYYAYEFSKNIDSAKRSAFIHSLKFPDGRITKQDKNTFIMNAVDKLDSEIALPSYKLIVYPESLSELNREMLRYLNRFASPDIVNMELVKTLPSRIEFDYNRFRMEILEAKLPNGKGRYTELQKKKCNSQHSKNDG